MNRLSKTALALAAFGVLAPQPVSAQSAPVQDDLLCLAAMSYLASMDDENTRQAGNAGAMFFLGKVFAGDPGIDLDTSLLATAKRLDAEKDKFSATLQRCGGELEQRGGQLAAAGTYVVENAD